MILVLLFCCAQSATPMQNAPATVPASPTPESSQPAVEPYSGSLRSGRVELARLSNADEHDAARELAAQLLAKPDFDLASESERAETLYAIGVVHGRQSSISEAVEAFHRARGWAGSSELGRDAAYNAGTYLLLGAEELRRQIPEIREKLGLPALPAASAPQLVTPPPGQMSGQMPGQPPAHGTQPAQPPDTLKLAREAYLTARRALVEAWRGDPSLDDCRANLELLQRRLRELAELEEQREQDKEEQSKQDQKDQKQDEEDKQDPSESKPEDQKQDQKSKDDAQQDPEEPKEQEQPKPDEKPEEKEEPQPQESQPDDAREEMLMTPEEMQRLLDQLQRIDEQAEKVQALLRERRRAPVKKDW